MYKATTKAFEIGEREKNENLEKYVLTPHKSLLNVPLENWREFKNENGEIIQGSPGDS